MITIIDYGVGNLFSLSSSLSYLGLENKVSRDPEDLRKADHIILPGVGAYGDAIAKLRGSGMAEPLLDEAKAGKPIMGICLGMQLLFDKSYEYGEHQGLGLIPGVMADLKEDIPENLKVPHMGWNSLRAATPCRLLAGVEPTAEFYFVHGYYVEPDPALVIATTVYGREFCSLYGRDGLWAAQFHPEKSGRPGLALLRNFYEYCWEARHAQ